MSPRGDEGDLFAELHDPLVGKLTAAFDGDRHLAEEAATFAWLVMLRRQPERSNGLGGWLYVTGLREGWRLRRRGQREGWRLRRRGQRQDLFEMPEIPAVAGAGRDPLEVVRERDQLQLLEQLPDRQRLTLTLFAAGYSYNEIAGATGHTYTWVNRQMTKGRAALRQLADDQ